MNKSSANASYGAVGGVSKKVYEKPAIRDLPTGKNKLGMVGEVGDSIECLPVAFELLTDSNAISGHFSRTWETTGIIFDANRIEHGCPMVLWVVPGIPALYWIARIVQADRNGSPPSGSLRLVGNPSQPGAMQGGLSALANSSHVDLNALGLPDQFGGWTVGGHLGVLVQGEGLLAVRFQGICRNVRVLWSAISQAHSE